MDTRHKKASCRTSLEDGPKSHKEEKREETKELDLTTLNNVMTEAPVDFGRCFFTTHLSYCKSSLGPSLIREG